MLEYLEQEVRKGRSDLDLLTEVRTSLAAIRTNLDEQARRAAHLHSLHYHLFVRERDGQRFRVGVNDLEDFCTSFGLNLEQMIMISNGGRGGLESHRGYRRGPGQNTLMNGSAWSPQPEPDPTTLDDKPRQPLFKPQPKPQPKLKPAITYQPKGVN